MSETAVWAKSAGMKKLSRCVLAIIGTDRNLTTFWGSDFGSITTSGVRI